MLASLLRVVRGYHRHAHVMDEVRDEQTAMLAEGYGEPLDGFPATAAAVAWGWRDRIDEDIRKQDDVDFINTLVSTVRETGRYYSEADLTWSKVWSRYSREHEVWIKEVRSNAISANEHRAQFRNVFPALRDRLQ